MASTALLEQASEWFGVRGSAMIDDDLGSGSSVGELGALYGQIRQLGKYRVALGAGISRVVLCEAQLEPMSSGVTYDARDRATVGMPLAARVAFHPVPAIGLGVQLLGNLNGEQFIAAWTFRAGATQRPGRLSATS